MFTVQSKTRLIQTFDRRVSGVFEPTAVKLVPWLLVIQQLRVFWMRKYMASQFVKWTSGCVFFLFMVTFFLLYFVKRPVSSKLGPHADDPYVNSTWYPPVDNLCLKEKIPDYILQPESDEITVVTMFLDLGVFSKGTLKDFRKPSHYHNWLRVFRGIANRVVAYIEKDNDIDYFRKIRSCLPLNMTKIVKVDRNTLPSFKLLPKIRKLYSRPFYPKHYPGTVYPEYTATMHAKHDVLERSILEDPFKTPYFAWLDVGLFRNLANTSFPMFKMVPPKNLEPESIAFTQVSLHDPNLSPRKIIYDMRVWVSGSMALAKKDIMLKFSRDYKQAAEKLLDQGLSNSDQEVINSMYTKEMIKPSYIKIQPYTCEEGQYGLHEADAQYFCLGYASKDTWEKRYSHLRVTSQLKT